MTEKTAPEVHVTETIKKGDIITGTWTTDVTRSLRQLGIGINPPRQTNKGKVANQEEDDPVITVEVMELVSEDVETLEVLNSQGNRVTIAKPPSLRLGAATANIISGGVITEIIGIDPAYEEGDLIWVMGNISGDFGLDDEEVTKIDINIDGRRFIRSTQQDLAELVSESDDTISVTLLSTGKTVTAAKPFPVRGDTATRTVSGEVQIIHPPYTVGQFLRVEAGTRGGFGISNVFWGETNDYARHWVVDQA